MNGPNAHLTVSQEGEVTIVELLDRNILEEANITAMGDHIGSVIDEQTNPKLLIDFQHVEHLSSAALGSLIKINTKIKEKGGQLRLSNIDPQIREVFLITKLNKLFQIHDDRSDALASFS
jgi:anti-sigma B factor antagonist